MNTEKCLNELHLALTLRGSSKKEKKCVGILSSLKGKVVYLNNLVLTDLDTFFVISLPLQKRIVRECLDEERSSEETILPF